MGKPACPGRARWPSRLSRALQSKPRHRVGDGACAALTTNLKRRHAAERRATRLPMTPHSCRRASANGGAVSADKRRPTDGVRRAAPFRLRLVAALAVCAGALAVLPAAALATITVSSASIDGVQSTSAPSRQRHAGVGDRAGERRGHLARHGRLGRVRRVERQRLRRPLGPRQRNRQRELRRDRARDAATTTSVYAERVQQPLGTGGTQVHADETAWASRRPGRTATCRRAAGSTSCSCSTSRARSRRPVRRRRSKSATRAFLNALSGTGAKVSIVDFSIPRRSRCRTRR